MIDLTKCPYCGAAVTLSKKSDHRYSKDFGPIWECDPCLAWVGCHKRGPGNQPLGTVASNADRTKRQIAHARFDPLWRAKMEIDGLPRHKARNAAYVWLAGELGLPVEHTHIAMMNGAMLARVEEVCLPVLRGIRDRG